MLFKIEPTTPQNEIEQKIHDILVEEGYSSDSIEFRQRGDNCYHLRVGYWEQLHLSEKAAQEIFKYVQEEDYYDDDCGWLYPYYFKK